MHSVAASSPRVEPAAIRLARLATLSSEEVVALNHAGLACSRIAPHREIIREGKSLNGSSILLDGWAYRVHFFPDGRRQILSFLMPGDMIGFPRHSDALAANTVVALTNVLLCRAPEPERPEGGLAEAYARSAALEEIFLYRQIARLGRMSAQERLVDFLLEAQERLDVCGLANRNSFPFPVTQEVLADALGLTSVHVNRTLQNLRREDLLDLRNGIAELKDAVTLRALVNYRPAAAVIANSIA